jgi:hypothetical protein
MAEESRTYPDVERARFEELRSQIAAYVTLPPGDAGAIESQGVKGRYAYDANAKTLTLTLEEVPFFIPRAMIWSTIERALRG